MNGAKVLVLGIAYKNDIDDYRESPALKVIEILQREEAKVEFYDPYIKEYKYKGKIHKGLGKIDANKVKDADLVIFTAAHKIYDYEMISKNAKAIFDTRNAMKNIKDRDYRDSNREIAPLRKAEDAIYIDSSDMTIEEVVYKVIDIIKMARI